MHTDGEVVAVVGMHIRAGLLFVGLRPSNRLEMGLFAPFLLLILGKYPEPSRKKEGGPNVQ